ncbi:hypothetical protein E5676_scaffold1814G00230 [Cucumis melo var. makuwa]|uniref:Uncharacterized protein n=1 Tax=Cucumis melo var. makuwa TaxID=1194695 RepID=A0A5D3DCQ9_CUCMM|nr:hypothetical protein E5676_scaffold1814G00230 [Cucumis melo var. makuwa]
MGRHQLYTYQLTTEVNVWLFFIKKKILFMWHDSTRFFDYAMLLYCIQTKTTIDEVAIIQETILIWIEVPKAAKPFSSTVEKLCLKYIPSFT